MKSDYSPTRTHSPWPHRWAVALVCVTFPLIWVGGLVTTYDAGMAVPDWPSTYGYNLFLYPWTTWLFGPFDLFIEHGHRLLGALAGLITIGLLVTTWRKEQRLWVRLLAAGALVLVILQGVLGGARVLFDQRVIALIHGCVGPAFFAYAVALAVVMSEWWRTVPGHERSARPRSSRLVQLALFTAALVYVQLILGARLRHAAPDSLPTAFMIAVVFHVAVALLVLVHGLTLAAVARKEQNPAVGRPTLILAALLVVQILLGFSVWLLKFGWPMGLNERFPFAATTIVEGSMLQAMTTTAHVALGSLILAMAVMSALRCCRLFRGQPSAAPRPAWNWEVAR